MSLARIWLASSISWREPENNNSLILMISDLIYSLVSSIKPVYLKIGGESRFKRYFYWKPIIIFIYRSSRYSSTTYLHNGFGLTRFSITFDLSLSLSSWLKVMYKKIICFHKNLIPLPSNQYTLKKRGSQTKTTIKVSKGTNHHICLITYLPI